MNIQHWLARARSIMPSGVSSDSRKSDDPEAFIAARARGVHLWDADGRKVLDYTCGNGAVLFGYADPDINAAISAQLELGVPVDLTHTREIELCEALAEVLPGIESFRLHQSATAAIQTALILARAATNRRKIIRFSRQVHGHAALGTGEEVLVLPWNDVDGIRRVFAANPDAIAAVLAEAIATHDGCREADDDFFPAVRALCNEHGAIFILDETNTGFRLGLQGAQGHYLINGRLGPDLCVYGKAIGAGLPIGVLAGKRVLMERIGSEEAQHHGFYNGNAISVAAAMATLSALKLKGVTLYPKLIESGRALMAELERLGNEAGVEVQARGPGPMFSLTLGEASENLQPRRSERNIEPLIYRRFRHEMQARGVRILPGGRWFLSAAHQAEDHEFALAVARASLGQLNTIVG